MIVLELYKYFIIWSGLDLKISLASLGPSPEIPAVFTILVLDIPSFLARIGLFYLPASSSSSHRYITVNYSKYFNTDDGRC